MGYAKWDLGRFCMGTAALSARGYRDGAMRYKMISPTYVPVEGDFWQARHGTRPCRMDSTPAQHGLTVSRGIPFCAGYRAVWDTLLSGTTVCAGRP